LRTKTTEFVFCLLYNTETIKNLIIGHFQNKENAINHRNEHLKDKCRKDMHASRTYKTRFLDRLNKCREEWKEHVLRIAEDGTVRIVRDIPSKREGNTRRHSKRWNDSFSVNKCCLPNFNAEEEEEEF
jgi:hypothetical protein